MKKIRIISLVLAFMMLLSLGALAVDSKASDQINRYDIRVTPTTGYINVKASIYGKGDMDKIGCESIYVYEYRSAAWTLVGHDDESDPDMYVENLAGYLVNKQYDTRAGREYKVVVTVFAEKDGVRDTRTRTYTVTGE